MIEAEIDLAALYAEFADEDQKLAEEGLLDYNEGLTKEDILWLLSGTKFGLQRGE